MSAPKDRGHGGEVAAGWLRSNTVWERDLSAVVECPMCECLVLASTLAGRRMCAGCRRLDALEDQVLELRNAARATDKAYYDAVCPCHHDDCPKRGGL